MAETKKEKGKKKKNNKMPEDNENKDINNGDEKKAKKKRNVEPKLTPEDKEIGSASKEGTLSSLPMESKGTGTLLEDISKTEKEEKKEDNGIRRPLKWHPDEIHCRQLCLNCLKINYYWPPRPRPPTPPGKDPNLIYPGDVDPDFRPARGDILIVHPKGLGVDPKPSPDDLWWKSKRIGGGFCICYDGDKKFKFEEGDLVLRIGSYVEEEFEAPIEDQEKEPERKSNPKKGKKSLKPKKIADPPQLDPVTYKPYDKVELYSCTGSELFNEEELLDIDPLEVELKRVVEGNTNYDISFGKITTRKSWKPDGNLVLKGDAKQSALKVFDEPPKNKNSNTKIASQEKGVKGNEVNMLEPLVDPENKAISKAEDLALNFVTSRDLEKSGQRGQTESESQRLYVNKGPPKDEKPPKVKLIWTFLGSQSQLHIDENVTPIADPKCPGLGCFYTPYLNLGNHCKKQDHNHAPYLADILIPEEAWSKKFDHRKNEWRSLVEWYLDPPPLQMLSEGHVGPIDDLAHEGEASNLENEKGKRRNSKEKGEKNKDKEGVGEKGVAKGKGNKQEEKKKSMDASSKEEDLVKSSLIRKKSKDGKGKELILPSNDMLQDKADKAIQVPQDLEEKDENLDSQIVPTNLRKELTLGTMLVRPLVGRKLGDEQTPIEEWKWPRKYKLWGSAEMYMVEQGAENLDWVFWGKSDRICDTPYPLPGLGAKRKFMHPKDAKVEVPGMQKDMGEERLAKEDDTNEPLRLTVLKGEEENTSPMTKMAIIKRKEKKSES